MSKLLHHPLLNDKVIIGEYRVDIEADQMAEKKLSTKFNDINVITSVEGRKLIPIQEIIKIEQRLIRDKETEYRRGNQDGYQQGKAEGHLEAQKVIDNFANLIKDAIRQREILYEEAHGKILDLVTNISRKVTFEAARVDPDITSQIIFGAIKRLVDKSKIKVKVHPDHLPLLEQQIDQFRGDSTAVKELSIEADSRVRYGGCFIETPTGDIDARLESQIEIIAEALGEVEATT